MIQIFKALSDANRLRILSLIWKNEMCVCEIERTLCLTQSNVSRHLTLLRNAGLITAVKRPPWIYYRLSNELLRDHAALCDYLDLHLKKQDAYRSNRRISSAGKQSGKK